MPKRMLMDVYHLNLAAPGGLPEREYRAMRRVLGSAAFRTALLSSEKSLV